NCVRMKFGHRDIESRELSVGKAIYLAVKHNSQMYIGIRFIVAGSASVQNNRCLMQMNWREDLQKFCME
ncbi:hypothetical protein L9F63_016106, partial [Diploptera punctata]